MTWQDLRKPLLMHHFNSHPHEEDDKGYYLINGKILYFNSHPHEEDDVDDNVAVIFDVTFQLTSSRRG